MVVLLWQRFFFKCMHFIAIYLHVFFYWNKCRSSNKKIYNFLFEELSNLKYMYLSSCWFIICCQINPKLVLPLNFYLVTKSTCSQNCMYTCKTRGKKGNTIYIIILVDKSNKLVYTTILFSIETGANHRFFFEVTD